MLVAAACGQATPAPTPTGGAGASATTAPAARGQGGELKIIYWQAPTILNPHQAGGTKDNDASRLIVEPLASWGPDGKPVAILAAEVPTLANGGVSKDLTTVTWKLKTGVKWSDGSAFTADDVAFMFTYRCNADTAATTASACKSTASVTAKDPNTVVVTYKQPNANFYEWGVGTQDSIIQKAQFNDCVGAKAKDCPANLKPIGTGPYKLVEFKPGDVVSYAMNDNFRDPSKPFFKTVTIKGGGDAEGAARAVCQTGEADYGWNLQIPLAVLQPMLSAAASKCQFPSSYNALERITVNFANPDPALGEKRSEPDTKHPFLSDLNVRRALAMSANRAAVAEQLYGKPGGEAYCNVIVFPRSKNTDSLDVCKYDVAAAEKVLQDNGWVKGTDGVRAKDGVKLVINYQTSTNAARQKTQEILKADWEKIGFKVNITNSSATTFFTNTAPDGYAKFYADLEEFASSQDPDPTSFLEQYICEEANAKANNWNKNNIGRYCDPAFDAIIKSLKAETDQAKRDQLAIQANDYLVKNVAVISLVNRTAPTPNGFSKGLKGVKQSPFDSSLWDVMDWTK
ncbi:MAG TPA: peptide ABC transporter substrate-binding protein [Candidatus Limnocylindria bacterium]|nr:peptide ABC transporter substrate-binding protein [Candidatus Limnocylindria bacterium]